MANDLLTIKQSTLVAAAGEYYVLARLSLLGKIAAQAPRGVPNADIVVSSVAGDRLCAVQVKARQGKGADKGWHMQAKHESIVAANLFYAFVDFRNLKSPDPVTYIIPSETVAEVLRVTHATWLKRPGIRGQKHNDTKFRRFMPDFTRNCGELAAPYTEGWLDPYREAWGSLHNGGL